MSAQAFSQRRLQMVIGNARAQNANTQLAADINPSVGS
jgi:hypothetical protein